MRLSVITFLFLTLSWVGYAQAPQKFSFQGVARNAAGQIIASTTIGLRLSIIKHADENSVVYQETHSPLTTSAGIFNVLVGGGLVKNGSLSNMKWSYYEHSLRVELDVTGGENYVNLGDTKLSSVPYSLFTEEAGRWINNDPIIQTGLDDQGGFLAQLNPGNMLVWYPRKAAFRVGRSLPFCYAWDDDKIGKYSASFGVNSESSGMSSTSMGSNNVASGEASFSVGDHNDATGSFSSAIGSNTMAGGKSSFSTGDNTFAKAHSSTTLGQFNNKDDNPTNTPVFFDRILQIGNGFNDANRSNALTVLRNGKIGIGNNALAPEYILDVGGRPRIRHNENASAGILLDDFNDSPSAFMGLKSNTEIGFFHANKWSFWVDGQGSAHIASGVLQTSDKRLKRDFSSLSNSLTKLIDLDGYHYFWKDSTLDQSLQTGLIAQEVEAIFPELVRTDDQGFKSVNYTGLIPHLIESVKTLKKENEGLKDENKSIKRDINRLNALEERMDALMKGLSTNSENGL